MKKCEESEVADVGRDRVRESGRQLHNNLWFGGNASNVMDS